MIYLSEVRKSPEGLAFNEAPSLLESIKERYDQVLNLEQLQASGQVVYDNGLYLLDYQLSYDITLPSSRSLEPATLGFNYLVLGNLYTRGGCCSSKGISRGKSSSYLE